MPQNGAHVRTPASANQHLPGAPPPLRPAAKPLQSLPASPPYKAKPVLRKEKDRASQWHMMGHHPVRRGAGCFEKFCGSSSIRRERVPFSLHGAPPHRPRGGGSGPAPPAHAVTLGDPRFPQKPQFGSTVPLVHSVQFNFAMIEASGRVSDNLTACYGPERNKWLGPFSDASRAARSRPSDGCSTFTVLCREGNGIRATSQTCGARKGPSGPPAPPPPPAAPVLVQTSRLRGSRG